MSIYCIMCIQAYAEIVTKLRLRIMVGNTDSSGTALHIDSKGGELIKDKIYEFIYEQDTLEKRLFWTITIVGTVITLFSAIVTTIENLNHFATVSSIVCFAFMLTNLIVAYKFKKQHGCYILMCYFLNCVLLPITFFCCGGIDSGMMLYFLVSMFICTPCLKGKQRICTFVVGIAALLSSIIVSEHFPQLVAELSSDERFFDVEVSFVLTSLCVFFMNGTVVNSYEKERRERQLLYNQLEELSRKDALTQLYNRRVLFEKLESHLADISDGTGGFYVMMIDIDNFKKINDSYGHQFGDRVLVVLSEMLRGNTDGEEIAARYGGEEFVVLYSSATDEEAYKRADKIRAKIADYRWEENPALKITVSGGIVSFSCYDDTSRLLSRADELLYKAKTNGKNKILSE